MSFHADVEVARNGFSVRAALDVGDDEIVAVVGPNGAGKSTLLLGLAGLIPRQGTVAGPSPIGVVFQERRLFPHLTVLDNVAFAADVETARAALARVGAGDLASARPADLSGGQAQRVAVARTLAAAPRTLLLDEPFTALDSDSRAAVRRVIVDFDGPRLLVTHSPLEAAGVASRLVVIEDGGVVQEGTLADLAGHPRSAYVADFVGINRLVGRVLAGGAEIALDGGGAITGPTSLPVGAVVATIEPRAIALYDDAPAGTPRNVFAGHVTDVVRLDERVRVTVDGPPRLVAEVTVAAATELALAPGRPIHAVIKASEVMVHPA